MLRRRRSRGIEWFVWRNDETREAGKPGEGRTTIGAPAQGIRTESEKNKGRGCELGLTKNVLKQK
jgi:hypothetical protein